MPTRACKEYRMVELLIFYLIFMSTLLVGGFTVSVLFLLTINRTLKLVSHEFRKISPSLVWFCLIPLFGIFFAIWMVQAVAASLRRQFEELGQGDSTVSYGLAAGRVWLYLIVAAEVILVAGYVFDYSDFAGLACNLMLMISFVSWIVDRGSCIGSKSVNSAGSCESFADSTTRPKSWITLTIWNRIGMKDKVNCSLGR
jgi:hypothetical protein